MIFYYCITIIANIVAAIAFQKNINITDLSLIPLFLIALMVFQALIFRNEKVENGFRTAYGSNLTADEENKLLSSGSSFLFATIPWMIPFILFFPSFVKVLSVLVYIVGLIGGLILADICCVTVTRSIPRSSPTTPRTATPSGVCPMTSSKPCAPNGAALPTRSPHSYKSTSPPICSPNTDMPTSWRCSPCLTSWQKLSLHAASSPRPKTNSVPKAAG